MKKTYIIPETKTVKIELHQIIAASTEMGINSDGPALESETNVASRRGGSLWDDDDE